MNSYYHAQSCSRKWGGTPDDYLPIHSFIDSSKQVIGDARHRSMYHHTMGVFLAERIFGTTILVGRVHVPVRLVVERHVLEDLGWLPSIGVTALAPRRLAWRRFLDPWAGPIAIIEASDDANSWFFQLPRDQVRSDVSVRLGWQSMLSPAVLLLPATIGFLIAHIPVHDAGATTTHPWLSTLGYWSFVALFDLGCAILAGSALAVGAAMAWIIGAATGDPASRETKRQRAQAAREERERAQLLRQLLAMTCGDSPPALSVGDLPSEKRTVHLRFADLKTRVCKPFAR